MSEEENPEPSRKGVIFKVFGVILMFLGTLDLMLFWRGSMPVSRVHVTIFLTGVLFFAIGALRGRYGGRRAEGVES